ncbi:MAG TPA: hypothetical protein VKU00_07395 [Chthonomonadaceae bacterium]|nr:hypothetical protein [Chthonomonadaceae bacterium]
MHQVTLEEAATRLQELVEEANSGEEVILLKNDLPIAKLVAMPPSRPRARRGSAKGSILYIAPDFDATPEGFEDYMP